MRNSLHEYEAFCSYLERWVLADLWVGGVGGGVGGRWVSVRACIREGKGAKEEGREGGRAGGRELLS